MNARRAWRMVAATGFALLVAVVLAACANSASQGAVSGAPDAATATLPASVATLQGRPVRIPPTGGPQPPQRHVPACKVDADCTGTAHCKGVQCRCVRDRCIVAQPALDPVVDPAPVPPPET